MTEGGRKERTPISTGNFQGSRRGEQGQTKNVEKRENYLENGEGGDGL
jgi:hypothetical protein